MALSTSTSTLAAGDSRTFNLSPGSALTLVAPPNVRATVTETPSTVSASDVGGNASRTHNLQLGQTVTYGPYPMGGTVVVANASNSGATITWVRSDSIVAESAAGAVSLVSGDGSSFLYGPVTSGTWMKVPSLFRLRITGTGTLQMDSKDSQGNITLATFPLTSYTSETDKIEFPYAGDDAVTIRVTLTGTLTCEVI